MSDNELKRKSALLQELAKKAYQCQKCRLAKTRTNVVFGVGNACAKLLFIGEGPGKEEDLKGEPFVGRSGQLLDRLCKEELNMTREDFYIANVVKCRPPNNRDPQEEEIDACRGYLEKQIEIINPKVIVTLGNYSTKFVLNRSEGIKALRGRIYQINGRHVVPTFHPAAALRAGAVVVAQMRADLIRAKQALWKV